MNCQYQLLLPKMASNQNPRADFENRGDDAIRVFDTTRSWEDTSGTGMSLAINYANEDVQNDDTARRSALDNFEQELGAAEASLDQLSTEVSIERARHTIDESEAPEAKDWISLMMENPLFRRELRNFDFETHHFDISGQLACLVEKTEDLSRDHEKLRRHGERLEEALKNQTPGQEVQPSQPVIPRDAELGVKIQSLIQVLGIDLSTVETLSKGVQAVSSSIVNRQESINPDVEGLRLWSQNRIDGGLFPIKPIGVVYPWGIFSHVCGLRADLEYATFEQFALSLGDLQASDFQMAVREAACVFDVALPLHWSCLREQHLQPSSETWYTWFRMMEFICRVARDEQLVIRLHHQMKSALSSYNLVIASNILLYGCDSLVLTLMAKHPATLAGKLIERARDTNKILPRSSNEKDFIVADNDVLCVLSLPFESGKIQVFGRDKYTLSYAGEMKDIQLDIASAGVKVRFDRSHDAWIEANLSAGIESLRQCTVQKINDLLSSFGF